jgi:hypothetical protein
MPYKNRIKMLEESYRVAENQISVLEKSDNVDAEKIKRLHEAKDKYFNELRELRKIQWDHDHERVDLDDDR